MEISNDLGMCCNSNTIDSIYNRIIIKNIFIDSSVATILFFKRKKEIEIEKEKNAMLFDDVLDIKILKKIPLKTIESYLRQEKLKNLQKEN